MVRGKSLDTLKDMDGLRFKRSRNVLLVEDSAEWAEDIRSILLDVERIVLDHALDLDTARFLVGKRGYDLMLIDRNLEPGDGLQFLTTLRRGGNLCPAILLTSMGETQDVISGLEGGGDYYVVKPPRPTELKAIVHRMLERGDVEGKLFIGALEVNYSHNFARFGQNMVKAEQRALNVLGWLALHDCRPVSMADMLRDLWDYNEIVWKDGRRRTMNPGKLVDKNIALLRTAIESVGIDRNFVHSHDADMPDAEYDALFIIDEEQAKSARSLTRRWSLDPSQLNSS